MALTDYKHPLIWAFREMSLVSRRIITDGNGDLFIVETRRDPRSGERQRFTYPLDTLPGTTLQGP